MKTPVHLLLLALLVTALPAQAEEDMFLTIKTGELYLQENQYDSSVYGPLLIDTDSDSTGAIGMEWLVRDRWLLGFELYKLEHSWRSTLGERDKLEGRMAMFTGKLLFNTHSMVQPYIGGGAGLVYLDFNTGDSWENEGMVAGHLGGGVLFRFDSIAAYVEGRHFETLSTSPDYEFMGSSMYGGIRFGF